MPLKRLNEALPPHLPGAPPRPKALSRATRNAWNGLIEELAGRLYQDDADLLLELIQCRADQYKGAGERKEAGRKRSAEILLKLTKRDFIAPPEPTPAPENGKLPCVDLEGFLGAVRRERASFTQRLVHGETVCLEAAPGQRFLWPEGHPATTARDYCQQATQGSLVACDSTRRACARHLPDLEHGHERGLFYDPVAGEKYLQTGTGILSASTSSRGKSLSSPASFHGSAPRDCADSLSHGYSMGKKNGKTTLASGIGLFGLVADQEKYAAVYSAATKKDQAKIVYGDGVRAVHANPALLEQVREFKTGRLVVEETDRSFEPLSSDIKSMEGLRPSLHYRGRNSRLAKPQPMGHADQRCGQPRAAFHFLNHNSGRK